jgi:hypothetical protein
MLFATGLTKIGQLLCVEWISELKTRRTGRQKLLANTVLKKQTQKQVSECTHCVTVLAVRSVIASRLSIREYQL